MSLETPTNLQGWSEGPRPAGIEWAGSETQSASPSEETRPGSDPASYETPSTTEPLPREAEPAPSEWQVGDERQGAEEAPAEWQAAPADEAPAEWRAEPEEAPAAEEATPAEWQVEAERTEPSGEAPAEWQTAGEPSQDPEAAPAEWQTSEEGAAAAEAPAEWGTEAEQTQPTEAGEERSPGSEAPPETAPAGWRDAEAVDHAGEWVAQGGETAEVPETSADFVSPQPPSGPRAEWSAQEPRAAGEASAAEVPQDAWEDEPVEDATEAPAEWTEPTAGEAAAAEPAELIALPGPGEGVAEETGPAAEAEVPPVYEEAAEATHRFQRPLATPPFGAPAAAEPTAAQGEDQADEWPEAAETSQEEVAWLPPGEALSAADVATLSALGIDPGDGTGAIRALVCLVRVLNRRQAIDVEELAAEIRESRAASAAEVATPEGNPDAEATESIASPRE
jgi:hypothetical protein